MKELTSIKIFLFITIIVNPLQGYTINKLNERITKLEETSCEKLR